MTVFIDVLEPRANESAPQYLYDQRVRIVGQQGNPDDTAVTPQGD